ncbi:MAG: hypothetical protein WA871_15355 [Candidatus Acidiferrales bacterium]
MPHTLRKSESSEARLQGREKRRGVRLNSRVPVTIEWQATTGQPCQEKAHTRVVGPYGCLLVIPADVQVEQPLRVTNLASSRSNQAVVVWRGHKQADGWELGIELIEPEMDFWGLDL